MNEMTKTLIKHLKSLEVTGFFSGENGELLFVCVYFYVISIVFSVGGEFP